MKNDENIINHFVASLGDGDIYSQILAEELLKGIMNEESLFLFGKQEQERDQTNNDSSK